MGDVAITWERSQAVEFSFFTLADSGAFATHAPRRLNEALALVRPFRWEVWPILLLTIAISGPALYLIIVAPTLWKEPPEGNIKRKRFLNFCRNRKTSKDDNEESKIGIFNSVYIREMNYGYKNVLALNKKLSGATVQAITVNLGTCIWYIISLFLKQCECLYRYFLPYGDI